MRCMGHFSCDIVVTVRRSASKDLNAIEAAAELRNRTI